MSLHNLQNTNNNFDPTVTHEDFLNQLLSWSDLPAPDHFDDHSTFLSSKLHQQQITGEPALFLNDHSSFKSPVGDNGSTHNLFHGFTRTLALNQPQQFHNLSPQSFGSPGPVAAGGGGGAPSQPRQRVRARRGQATDPHSIAERLRRERITERMKALQELVPNTHKADKASMLDDIIEYVRFLQLQVKVLSTSRLGGDTVGVERGIGRNSQGRALSSHNDTMTVTEKQVVKLMEQDMGSAMQYLQGKGLCLMPISLASTISSGSGNNYSLGGEDGGGPSSPNMSVMTLQSANGVPMKDSP